MPNTRKADHDSVRRIAPAMISEKIGTSEFSTAAVPESMYCWPQLMRKIGRPAFTAPMTAR